MSRSLFRLFRREKLFSDDTIYESKSYIVRKFMRDYDGLVYVCFDGWMPVRETTHHAFGFQFLKSRDLNVIEIICKKNDWYQSDDIELAIAAIDQAAGRRVRAGYGSSMGGYGAINFAERLSLSLVLAFSPQYSVDPAKIPDERRWIADISLIASFKNDYARLPKTSHLIAFYDPNDRLDALHIKAIAKYCCNAVFVRMPFSGHVTAEFLGATGLLADIALGLFSGRLMPADVRQMIREKRREVGHYWAAASAFLASRGSNKYALRFAFEGYRNRSKYYPVSANQYAEMLYIGGLEKEAIHIWKEMLADADNRPSAEYLIRQTASVRQWDLVFLLNLAS